MTNTFPAKKIGIFAIATGLIIGAGYPLFKAQIIELAARLLSSDNSISQQGAAELAAVFYFFIVMLIIAGWVLIKADNTVWRAQFRQTILTDPLLGASPTPSPAFMLAFSFAAGVFLIIHINLYDPTSALFDALYLEDGLFEWLTAILMLVSSLLLGRTVFTLRKKASSETIYRLAMGIYLLFMVAFFIYAMEEISWGQRIFGWETPPVLAEKNIQNETNIHNFFNAYFPSVYKLFVLVPAPFFIAIWLEFKARWLSFNRFIMPHPSLVGLSLLIAFVAAVRPQEQELIEELVSSLVFFYSIRVYAYFRGPKKEAAP